MKSSEKVKEILNIYGINSDIEDLKQDKDFQLEILMIVLDSATRTIQAQGRILNRRFKSSTPFKEDSQLIALKLKNGKLYNPDIELNKELKEHLDKHIEEVKSKGFSKVIKKEGR